MKILLGAIALIVAAPVAAQSAPADPHAGHAKKDGEAGHEQHKGCCCEKMKAEAEKMECCKEHGEGHSEQHEGHAA